MKKEVFNSEKLSSPQKLSTLNFPLWRLISIFPLLFSAFFLLNEPFAHASPKNKPIPFTQEDRDRLVRLEVKVEEGFKAIDKRFEAIDKRFEAIDKRFEDMEKAIDKRFEAIDKRFEAIDKRFESMDKRFESIDAQFDRLINLMIGIVLAFAGIVAVTIGFAIWDRRTMIRPFEKKISDVEEEIAENRSKLHSLISALREFGGRNKELAEVLRRFNLM